MSRQFSVNDYVTVAGPVLTSCFSGSRGRAAFNLARIVIGSICSREHLWKITKHKSTKPSKKQQFGSLLIYLLGKFQKLIRNEYH